MAIPYDTIKTVLKNMGGIIGKMYAIVVAHEAGKVMIGNYEVILTDTQKDDLIAEYNNLKDDLATEYGELP